MTYFFILGNNTALSLAEIITCFPDHGDLKLLDKDVLLINIEKDIQPEEAIKNLGGTIKIGVIFDSIMNYKTEFIVNKTRNILKPGKNKYKFGISHYGSRKLNLKPVGMEIKKVLKEQGVSCRWVTGKEKKLSSVIVEQNKLIGDGIELSIIEDAGKFHLGRTAAVQPFKTLSFRDYGRPARDDQSGMLPPKLAQIMINLAGQKKDASLLDPFCGSGTLLTEAMLMGYENILGSDISAKAVKDTCENINWIKSKYNITANDPTVKVIDAAELSKTIKPLSVAAIISEPFLGQQKGGFDLHKQIAELEQIYTKVLAEFRKILMPTGKIVILFPVYFNKHKINPSLAGYEIINPIPNILQKNRHLNITERNTIIYGRSGQRVFREIVILKKQ